MGDEWYSLDPPDRPDTGDIATNTRYSIGGDVFYNIVDEITQQIDWYRQAGFDQQTGWNIFADILYYIQQFHVRPISLNFTIKDGDIVPFPGQNLPNDYSIIEPVKYNFTIKEPTPFDIYLDKVLSGTWVV